MNRREEMRGRACEKAIMGDKRHKKRREGTAVERGARRAREGDGYEVRSGHRERCYERREQVRDGRP